MAQPGPPRTHRLFRWSDTEAAIMVTLHDDGADERAPLALAQAVSPGAAVLGLRGTVAQGRGWRFLEDPEPGGALADTARLDALCRCIMSVLSAKRARLRDVIALGVGGGAMALTGLLCRCPQPFVAAVLLHPSASQAGQPGLASDLRGIEVLIVASSGGIGAAEDARARIAAAGGDVFTHLSKQTEAEDASIARNWLQARLGGGMADA